MGSNDSVPITTIKSYRKLAFELLLNNAMINDWIMYKIVEDVDMGTLEFQKSVDYASCNLRPPLTEAEVFTPSRNRLLTFGHNKIFALTRIAFDTFISYFMAIEFVCKNLAMRDVPSRPAYSQFRVKTFRCRESGV